MHSGRRNYANSFWEAFGSHHVVLFLVLIPTLCIAAGRLPPFPPWRNPAEFALAAPPRPVVNGRQQGTIIAISDLNWSWCYFSPAVVKHCVGRPTMATSAQSGDFSGRGQRAPRSGRETQVEGAGGGGWPALRNLNPSPFPSLLKPFPQFIPSGLSRGRPGGRSGQVG